MGVRAGRWRLIRKGASRHFKTSATEGCLLYYTESIKRTNTFGCRLLSFPDSRSFCCQPQASQVITVRPCLLPDTLRKIIIQGTVEGRRCRGRPHKYWTDNIKEWAGQLTSSLLRIVDDQGRWTVVVADASVGVPQRLLDVTSFSQLTKLTLNIFKQEIIFV